VVVALIASLAIAPADVHLTFVRHAETVANATGVYNSRTLNTFSERGKRQVAELTAQLRGRKFDRVLVSPSPRALRSIEPYLRESGQTAVVDSLLYECCTGRRPPGVRPAERFGRGARIDVPSGMEGVFTVEATADRLPAPRDFAEGLAQVSAWVESFWARNPSGHVLVVGHSGQGGEAIFRLTGVRLRVENAKPMEFGLRRPARAR
jgi:broad specificity phosphatase PhoE